MKRYGLGTLLLLAVITLASCAPALSAGGPQTGDAKVDSIEIRILESFPVQVQVIARGFLPDGCTTIDTVSVDRQGNTFTIRITTQRPADAICTQEVVPFEHTIPLDVQGLQAGTGALSSRARRNSRPSPPPGGQRILFSPGRVSTSERPGLPEDFISVYYTLVMQKFPPLEKGGTGDFWGKLRSEIPPSPLLKKGGQRSPAVNSF